MYFDYTLAAYRDTWMQYIAEITRESTHYGQQVVLMREAPAHKTDIPRFLVRIFTQVCYGRVYMLSRQVHWLTVDLANSLPWYLGRRENEGERTALWSW